MSAGIVVEFWRNQVCLVYPCPAAVALSPLLPTVWRLCRQPPAVCQRGQRRHGVAPPGGPWRERWRCVGDSQGEYHPEESQGYVPPEEASGRSRHQQQVRLSLLTGEGAEEKLMDWHPDQGLPAPCLLGYSHCDPIRTKHYEDRC